MSSDDNTRQSASQDIAYLEYLVEMTEQQADPVIQRIDKARQRIDTHLYTKNNENTDELLASVRAEYLELKKICTDEYLTDLCTDIAYLVYLVEMAEQQAEDAFQDILWCRSIERARRF